MREIKFRIWDIEEKKFIINKKDKISYWDTKKCTSERIDFDNNSVEINTKDRYSFLQYTGLNDVKGREIYEGDIICEQYGEYYKVVFKNGSFRAEDEEYSLDLIDLVAQKCEVIGNIYENSELLGE